MTTEIIKNQQRAIRLWNELCQDTVGANHDGPVEALSGFGKTMFGAGLEVSLNNSIHPSNVEERTQVAEYLRLWANKLEGKEIPK